MCTSNTFTIQYVIIFTYLLYFYRLYSENIAIVANEVGRKPPTFLDASKVANELVQLEYNSGKIIYNRFKYFFF